MYFCFSGSMDTAVLSEYLKQNSPIVTGIERRMIILNGTENAPAHTLRYKCNGVSTVPYLVLVVLASITAIVW